MTDNRTETASTSVTPQAQPAVEIALDENGRITIGCDCGKTLKAPGFRAGKTVMCPACRRSLPIPAIAKSPVRPTTGREYDVDSLIEKVRAEMERLDIGEKKSIGKNLLTLAVSVILFISLGFFRNSISGIAILVGVIFVHECGHFIGMKLFKYKDVQMFFIPLFGAAVSGKETAPSGGKKAIVSLLGPVPGIIIGFGTGIAYLVTRQPLLADTTRTFLFLNTFNLLPFHPLDGGRLFDALLFSRNPRIEVGFKIITTFVLGWLAYMFKDIFFGVFAFLVFMSLRGTHISANIAHRIRKGMDNADDCAMSDVSPEHLQNMVVLLKEKLPAEHWKPKLIATYVAGVWERVRNRPCSTGTTIGLFLCYIVCIVFAIFSVILFEVAVYAVENGDRETVEQIPARDSVKAADGLHGTTEAELR